jgi:hypothetical protein
MAFLNKVNMKYTVLLLGLLLQIAQAQNITLRDNKLVWVGNYGRQTLEFNSGAGWYPMLRFDQTNEWRSYLVPIDSEMPYSLFRIRSETPAQFFIGVTNLGYLMNDVAIPITVTNFTNICRFSFTVKWSAELVPIGFYASNQVAGYSISLGYNSLTVNWAHPQSVRDGKYYSNSWTNGEAICYLHFQVNALPCDLYPSGSIEVYRAETTYSAYPVARTFEEGAILW